MNGKTILEGPMTPLDMCFVVKDDQKLQKSYLNGMALCYFSIYLYCFGIAIINKLTMVSRSIGLNTSHWQCHPRSTATLNAAHRAIDKKGWVNQRYSLLDVNQNNPSWTDKSTWIHSMHLSPQQHWLITTKDKTTSIWHGKHPLELSSVFLVWQQSEHTNTDPQHINTHLIELPQHRVTDHDLTADRSSRGARERRCAVLPHTGNAFIMCSVKVGTALRAQYPGAYLGF